MSLFFEKRVNFWLIFIITFSIKLLLAYYLVSLLVCNNLRQPIGLLAILEGDTPSYIEAIENIFQKGKYYFTYQTQLFKEEVYASRLPHYGIIFGFYRLFTDYTTSCNLLVLTQILVEAISVIYLAMLCAYIFRKNIFFFFTWGLLTFNFFHIHWSIALIPESLAISFLIFFTYFTYLYQLHEDKKYFWLSNIFLALLVVMKPYFLPVYAFYSFLFFLKKKKITLDLVKLTFFTIIPLCILLMPWVIRNYVSLNKVIVLQQDMLAGYKYTKSHLSMTKFVKTWGGDNVYWEVKSPSYFFLNNDKIAENYKFPKYAFCSSYNEDTLRTIRKEMLALYEKENLDNKQDSILAQKFDQLSEAFKNEKYFHYAVLAPLIVLKSFLFHSGSYFLPINKNFPCFQSYQLIIKILQSVLYYLFLILGGIGLILMTLKGNKLAFLSIFLITFIISFFSFYLRSHEWRYFWTVFPLFVIGINFIFQVIFDKFSKSTFYANP